METTITINGHIYTATTERAESSYGQPVVLRDGEITDLRATHRENECNCTILGLLADRAKIWTGPATRRALSALSDEMYPDGPTCGADYDRIIAEFAARKTREEA